MDRVKELRREIQELVHDVTYDIDEDHHEERMRIIRAKREELKNLLKTIQP